MKDEYLKIKEQKQLAPNIFQVKLQGKSVREMTAPGQFVHVKIQPGIDPSLRRPLSIADVEAEKEELTLIYRTEGRGTKLLAGKVPGEEIKVFGPLGKGFPTDAVKSGDTCLLVGGGVGIPPLYYLGRQLADKGAEIITILGFRKAEDIFLEEEFQQLGKVIITTEDGTKGVKGYVTDAINQLASSYDTYYTCGPNPMLRAVEETAKGPGFVSMEERMGCGIGACLACVCQLKDPGSTSGRKYRKICSDGPVFPAGEVLI
jgi:dihydroorotate dehydrogenase electron transfer subunit